MKIQKIFILIFAFITCKSFAQDTLYFRLSNPWNTVKDQNGKYIRKCIKENDYYHVWDFNTKNKLVTESFYSDTNFTRKLFCHKYYDEKNGLLEQSRCYENGRLDGYFVSYDQKGDTTDYSVYQNGELIKSWSSQPQKEIALFTMNEEPAEFPGGQDAWLEYLSKNLNYPDSLQNIKGQILLKFIVDPTGKIQEVEIIKGLNPILDKEAVRIIKKSPKWKPAKQNGKKVQATITQPIDFG